MQEPEPPNPAASGPELHGRVEADPGTPPLDQDTDDANVVEEPDAEPMEGQAPTG